MAKLNKVFEEIMTEKAQESLPSHQTKTAGKKAAVEMKIQWIRDSQPDIYPLIKQIKEADDLELQFLIRILASQLRAYEVSNANLTSIASQSNIGKELAETDAKADVLLGWVLKERKKARKKAKKKAQRKQQQQPQPQPNP